MTFIITDKDMAVLRDAVGDPRMRDEALIILDKLQRVEVVGYSVTCDGVHCGNTFDTEKGAVAQKERLDRSHSENKRAVEPLYAIKGEPT